MGARYSLSDDSKKKTNLHLSPGFFRSLAYQFTCNANILRSPNDLTPRRREIMARLFDSLAKSAKETQEVLTDLQTRALPPDELDAKQTHRNRVNKLRPRKE